MSNILSIPWVRQLNNTAVSVDQLGTRKGAIAIYLDMFHKDIEAFLDVRLNNGDERMRARDIFPGITIPDMFMEAVQKGLDWHLFDPHEVHDKYGWYLSQFYDETKIGVEGKKSFREKYNLLVQDNDINKKVVNARQLYTRVMTSLIETGMPYFFFRDTVNRTNPNKDKGMIYCSNLC